MHRLVLAHLFLSSCGYKGHILLTVAILPTHHQYQQQQTFAYHSIATSKSKISDKTRQSPQPSQNPPKRNTRPKMYTKTLLLAAIAALAAASPIDVARPHPTGITPPFPIGTGAPPHGHGPPSGVPRPTSVPVPRPVGDKSDCSIDGKLVCNGPSQWGLCNWGKVQFQPVAAGTQCLDGEIVFAQGFGTNA